MKLIPNTLRRAFGFAYEAAEPSPRRRAIKVDTRPEDAVLDPKRRGRVVSGARDLRRNLAVAAWAIRTHCSHVAQHTFQARTGDAALDDAIEALMRTWSRAEHCDAAGRHPLYRLVFLLEMARVTDGDALLLLLDDGRLQAIEADRIAQPKADQLPKGKQAEAFVQGVEVSPLGAPQSYAIHARDAKGKLTFQMLLPAEAVIHHGYFDRLDQVRGVSPIAAAINPFLDLAENSEYALQKAKMCQMLALLLKRKALDGFSGTGTSESSPDQAINFGKGPTVLDLQEGDDAAFLYANVPGQSFLEFMSFTTMMALKALDLDYSFFDSSHTNYSGARQALLLYQRSAKVRQREVRDVLDRITRWKLLQWTNARELTLPRGLTVDQLRWEWMPAGLGWIDPLKEIKAHAAAVDAGLDSRQRIARERGEDWFELADQLAEEEAYAQAKGLTLTTTAAATLPEEAAAPASTDNPAPEDQP